MSQDARSELAAEAAQRALEVALATMQAEARGAVGINSALGKARMAGPQVGSTWAA